MADVPRATSEAGGDVMYSGLSFMTHKLRTSDNCGGMECNWGKSLISRTVRDIKRHNHSGSCVNFVLPLIFTLIKEFADTVGTSGLLGDKLLLLAGEVINICHFSLRKSFAANEKSCNLGQFHCRGDGIVCN